ncbi:MAG: hypothetical protein IT462_04905 [Planctomycetes bacterium]|nr:hypothetical protein [Planctomycetota bacterium]
MLRYLPLFALLLLTGCASQPVRQDVRGLSPWVTFASPSEESRIRAGVAPKYGADVFETRYDPILEHRRRMQELAPVEATGPRLDGHDPGMDLWRWIPQFKPRDPKDIPAPPEEDVCRDRSQPTPRPVDEVIDPEREITIDFVGKDRKVLLRALELFLRSKPRKAVDFPRFGQGN